MILNSSRTKICYVFICICQLLIHFAYAHSSSLSLSGNPHARDTAIEGLAEFDESQNYRVGDKNESASKIDSILKTLRERERNPPQYNESRPTAARVTIKSRRNVSQSAIDQARELVRAAQIEAGKRNAYLVSHPRRNKYASDPFDSKVRLEVSDFSILVNSTVKDAAALLTELDAAEREANGTLHRNYTLPEKYSSLVKNTPFSNSEYVNGVATPADFWMENIVHNGTLPFGGDTQYAVWRNVRDYGAVGDGKTDDTIAINNAISAGNRCGIGCGTSSVKGALVYFPSGTYLVSSSINALYNTQLVGNPNRVPTIRASAQFVGLGVITSDVYIPNANGQEWFSDTSNFLRQVRNFIIDYADLPATLDKAAGLHWQVAQGTSLQNLNFYGSTVSGTKQIGIFAENGSGGFMSQLTFFGGAIGIQCGNQQFTSRALEFLSCPIAIDMLWDWGWAWKSLSIADSIYGIHVNGTDVGGSLQVSDSTFTRCTSAAIIYSIPKGNTNQQTGYITLNNIAFNTTPVALIDTDTNANVPIKDTTVDTWILGRMYDAQHNNGWFSSEDFVSTTPIVSDDLLAPDGTFFEYDKPQYRELDASSFWHAKSVAKGDGVTDDTDAINLLLIYAAAVNQPVFFPAGSYIVTRTIKIPVGSRIIGECWSQLVAKGEQFSDMTSPIPMVKVGEPYDKGIVEIQDMLFTATGPTSGVTLVEWNLHQSSQGSAAMWVQILTFGLGGAAGTQLQAAQCPVGTTNAACIGASMMLHLTRKSSAYLENVWAWTADHDLDDHGEKQINVFTARGILIESQGPSWLYGTASEHAVFYQYELYNAANLFMCMIQTESPYFPPAPEAPTPFEKALKKFPGDPDFSRCAKDTTNTCAVSWALRILGSKQVVILSAGLYSWFQNYNQNCVDSQNCQLDLIDIQQSGDIWIYNLYTIGSVDMIAGASPVQAKDNTNDNGHPFVSTISGWFLQASKKDYKAISDGLGTNSSCAQLADGKFLDAVMFDELGGGDRLQSLADAMQPKPFTNFIKEFSVFDGIGESIASCSILAQCLVLNCHDLETEGASASAFNYTVEASMINLSNYFARLYNGVRDAYSNIAGMQVDIQDSFYPANEPGTLPLIELLGSAGAAVLAIGAWAEGPGPGVISNIIGGVAVDVISYLSDTSPSEQNLISMEIMFSKAKDHIKQILKAIYDNLLQKYFWVDNSNYNWTLAEVFAHGAWLIPEMIPVLDVPSNLVNFTVNDTVLTEHFQAMMVASAVNIAWQAQNVYIMCFPMTETNFATAGDVHQIEPRLRIYYQGFGCYFQSAYPKSWKGIAKPIPYPIRPNGWDKLPNETYYFTTEQIMKSSIDSYIAGGFSYNGSANLDNTLKTLDRSGVRPDLSVPGLFTIPICRLPPDVEAKTTPKEFFQQLDYAGSMDLLSHAAHSFCYCLSTKDKNGDTILKALGNLQSVTDECSPAPTVNCPGQHPPPPRQNITGNSTDGGTTPMAGPCSPMLPQ